MSSIRIVPVLVLALLCACSDKQTASGGGEQAARTQAAGQHLTELVEAYWEEYLALNPLNATFFGDNRFNDRLENSIGPQFLADTLALDKKYLE